MIVSGPDESDEGSSHLGEVYGACHCILEGQVTNDVNV